TDARHGAADHAPSKFLAAVLAFQLKLHARPWQQAMLRFDEDAARGHVDDRHQMSGSYPRPDDSVFLHAMSPPWDPAISRQIAHSACHFHARTSNWRIRVFPVCPKIRMTY